MPEEGEIRQTELDVTRRRLHGKAISLCPPIAKPQGRVSRDISTGPKHPPFSTR